MPLCHINADDFGLHRDIDRGVIACVEAGRVTGVSVSPNGTDLQWALARELASRVDVGIHVTLVGEPWMSQKRFLSSWAKLMPWLLLPGRRALLEREMRQQIQAMLDNGITPTHLDSHQHVHPMSPIWQICRRLATEFDIRRLRVPATPTRAIAKRSFSGSVLQRLSERRAAELPDMLRCIAIAEAGHNTASRLEEELQASNGQDVELVAHPAFDTPALRERYGSWRFDWETERSALLSDEFGEACKRLGYHFGRASARAT
jgi:chitin disaccharide deacetylase